MENMVKECTAIIKVKKVLVKYKDNHSDREVEQVETPKKTEEVMVVTNN